MSDNHPDRNASHSQEWLFHRGFKRMIREFETRPKSYGRRATIKAVASKLGEHLNNSAKQTNTNIKRKEAKMSQTYKHLSKLTKSELIQIIKDSDYTINVLTKQLNSRS